MTQLQEDNNTTMDNIEESISNQTNNNLDQESLNQIKETFSLFDQNNDNYITKQELTTLLRALGKNLTDLDINNLITENNIQNDSINFEQFLVILNKITPRNTENDLLNAYELFDPENNGFIKVNEFKHIMTNLGEKLTTNEIENIIQELDTNNEGKIYKNIFIETLLN
jgi:Ca2+-binding EF-hand superfamily protein